MAELGYRPHRAARALRTGRTQTIGLVVSTLATVGNSRMLQAVADAAAARGYALKAPPTSSHCPRLRSTSSRPSHATSSNPYVFAGRGGSHYSGYSKGKAALDAKVSIPGWRVHDLRRTARSLMARAGTRPDVAERVLGHVLPGVEGIYNRHTYTEEKAHALRALAGLIENILRPAPAEVTRLRG